MYKEFLHISKLPSLSTPVCPVPCTAFCAHHTAAPRPGKARAATSGSDRCVCVCVQGEVVEYNLIEGENASAVFFWSFLILVRIFPDQLISKQVNELILNQILAMINCYIVYIYTSTNLHTFK